MRATPGELGGLFATRRPGAPPPRFRGVGRNTSGRRACQRRSTSCTSVAPRRGSPVKTRQRWASICRGGAGSGSARCVFLGSGVGVDCGRAGYEDERALSWGREEGGSPRPSATLQLQRPRRGRDRARKRGRGAARGAGVGLSDVLQRQLDLVNPPRVSGSPAPHQVKSPAPRATYNATLDVSNPTPGSAVRLPPAYSRHAAQARPPPTSGGRRGAPFGDDATLKAGNSPPTWSCQPPPTDMCCSTDSTPCTSACARVLLRRATPGELRGLFAARRPGAGPPLSGGGGRSITRGGGALGSLVRGDCSLGAALMGLLAHLTRRLLLLIITPLSAARPATRAAAERGPGRAAQGARGARGVGARLRRGACRGGEDGSGENGGSAC